MKKEDLIPLIKAKGKSFKGRIYVNLTRDPMDMRGDDGTMFTVEPLGADIQVPDRDRIGEPEFRNVSKTGVALVTRAAKSLEVDEETMKALAEIRGDKEVYFMGTPFMLKAFPKLISVPIIYRNGSKARVYLANQMWVAE